VVKLIVLWSKWLFCGHADCFMVTLIVLWSHWLFCGQTECFVVTLIVFWSNWLFYGYTDCFVVTLIVLWSHWLFCGQVVDYLDKVCHPMDFFTMSEKINSHCYATFDSFAADFELIISNCLLYNEAGSYLHRYAAKMHKKVCYVCTEECVINSLF